ncbi:hypothetical protein LTR94_027910, partial [Friedmanniomyces endolithicus]
MLWSWHTKSQSAAADRVKKLEDRLDHVEDRQILLEGEFKHLPTKDDISALRLQLADVLGKHHRPHRQPHRRLSARESMSYEDKTAEDGRLVILKELALQVDGRLNEVTLQRVLETFAITRSREWVRTQLRKLAELEAIRITATRTDKVPNTSATAASSGADLNGMAAHNAAVTIRERVTAFLARTYGCDEGAVAFTPAGVVVGGETIPFGTVARKAHLGRVSLSATGFYATPHILYDRAAHKGRPFYYFAYGAAVSEVVIDTLTGEQRILALMETVDSYIPQPERPVDLPFLMPVEDVFSISGRGTV